MSMSEREKVSRRERQWHIQRVWVPLAAAVALLFFQVRAQVSPPCVDCAARRARIAASIGQGLLLLYARSAADESGAGFKQDVNFYYLTGLANVSSAVLAVVGTTGESWLFVPPPPNEFEAKDPVGKYIKPGTEAETRLSIQHVRGWDEFATFMDASLRDAPKRAVYIDDSVGFGEWGMSPPGLRLSESRHLGWREALRARWPDLHFESAKSLLNDARARKSAAEIAVMRRVGASSAAALLAAMRAIAPGRSQRQVEAEVLRGCVEAGAEGVSFWPWAMSGPNSVFPQPFWSLFDYRYLNRTMQSGEIVRLDMGCEVDHYQGDLGRTVPVSGRFDDGQREVWELLVRAYRAGVPLLKDGAKPPEVMAASFREVEQSRARLKTALGRHAAEVLATPQGRMFWSIHGIGLESAEEYGPVLKANMIVMFEPIFSVDGQGFYLEDMYLITGAGAELLTPGLPYSAEEIEKVMKGR